MTLRSSRFVAVGIQGRCCSWGLPGLHGVIVCGRIGGFPRVLFLPLVTCSLVILHLLSGPGEVLLRVLEPFPSPAHALH